MANLNYIKAILDGGITLENFAEGATPTGGNVATGTQVDLSLVSQPYTIIANTEITVPVKSRVLFDLAAEIAVTQNSAQSVPTVCATTLYVDSSKQSSVAAKIGIGVSIAAQSTNSGISANSGWITLAAGAHQVGAAAEMPSGTQGQSFASVYGCNINYLMVPTA
jgi:hypothetical protein